MILNSMLDNSPVFLFALTALLGVAYGAVALVKRMVRQARHWRAGLPQA